MFNTTQSEILFKASKLKVPGGVHSPVRAFHGVGGIPIFIKTAFRSQIQDVDDNAYVDYCMSWGPLLLGHQDPEILEAIQMALNRGWSYGTAEPYSLAFAEWLTETLPWIEKIRFVSSGTEAVMSVIRLARAITGRNKIIKFEGCYHGHVDSMLVQAGSGLSDMGLSNSAGIPRSTIDDTLVVPLSDACAFMEMAENNHSEIAAVIIEPMPANHGLLIQEIAFLKKIKQFTQTNGSLLIFDEVITGFRVGLGGMTAQTGIIPDLVTYGKIIGGGFPVGAYGGRRDYMNWIAPEGPVYQAGTLSANPIAIAAGFSTLKKLKRDQPYPDLQSTTQSLALALERSAQTYGIPLRVQQAASLFWLVFGVIQTNDGWIRMPQQIPEEHRKIYAKVFHELLKRGIYLAPSPFEVCFLSTAHTLENQKTFIHAFTEVMSQLSIN